MGEGASGGAERVRGRRKGFVEAGLRKGFVDGGWQGRGCSCADEGSVGLEGKGGWAERASWIRGGLAEGWNDAAAACGVQAEDSA